MGQVVVDHAMILREGQGYVWQQNVQDAQTSMEEAMAAAPALDSCQLRKGTKTWDWITTLLSMENGMEIGAQECCDALFLLCGIDPQYLPPHCDV